MKKNQIYTVVICIIMLLMLPSTTIFGQTNDEEPIKVTYRKDYIWHEPQYNLPGVPQFLLHREKTYADGRTVTETSYSTNCIHAESIHDKTSVGDFLYYLSIGDYHLEDNSLVRFEPAIYDWDDSYGRVTSNTGETSKIYYHSIGVPDISKLSWEEWHHDDKWSSRGNLYKFWRMDGVYLNPENPEPGWYYLENWTNFLAVLDYGDEYLREYTFALQDYGYILCADNQLFEYSEYKPTYDVDLRVKDAMMPNGAPAKILIYDIRRKYLGDELYIAIVDSIYQLSPEETMNWKPTPSTISHRIGDDSMIRESQSPKTMMWDDDANVIWRKKE